MFLKLSCCHIGRSSTRALAKFGYRSKIKDLKNNNPIIFWQLIGSWNLLSKYGNFKFLFSLQNQVILMHFLLKNPLGELQWIFFINKCKNKSKSFFNVIKVPFKVVCYFTK
jgi:hypothetical protein